VLRLRRVAQLGLVRRMKIPCVALILIGLGWILALIWEYLVLSGIASPPSLPAVLWYYGTRSVGPILLIVGATLILRQMSSKIGVILTTIGSAILTVSVAEILLSFLHVEPLERKPDYIDFTLYGFLGLIALAADGAVLRLYRLVFLMRGSDQRKHRHA
jgi:hypothetical protein